MNLLSLTRVSLPVQTKLLLLIITTVLTITVSIISLMSGWTTIFQNLYYFPIIIACVFFLKRGFFFSLLLIGSYGLLIHLFADNRDVVFGALIRILIFILVAATITYLALLRVAALEKSKEDSEYLRKLITYANAPILVWDSSFTITTFNQAFVSLTGIPSDEAVGSPIDILFPDSTKSETMDKIRRTTSGEQWDVVEIPVLSRSGEVRTILWNSANIHDKNGNTIATIAQGQDITKRLHAEEKLKNSLLEKSVLIREIHDRVRNNMQVISSLLSLQLHSIDETKTREIFKESEGRVRSIALVHERLYQSPDMSHIVYSGYLEQYRRYLAESYHFADKMISIAYEAEGVIMDVKRAVPCSLIINEIVTNSIRHGFSKEKGGIITIQITNVHDQYDLICRDDGVGISDEDLDNKGSLGLQIIHGLIHQLHGQVEIRRDNGTEFHITFP